MVSGSAVAAMNRRESGKEMEMGFPSGSVVPLPTAKQPCQRKISDETCIPENYSHPNTDTNIIVVGASLEANHLEDAHMSDPIVTS